MLILRTTKSKGILNRPWLPDTEPSGRMAAFGGPGVIAYLILSSRRFYNRFVLLVFKIDTFRYFIRAQLQNHMPMYRSSL